MPGMPRRRGARPTIAPRQPAGFRGSRNPWPAASRTAHVRRRRVRSGPAAVRRRRGRRRTPPRHPQPLRPPPSPHRDRSRPSLRGRAAWLAATRRGGSPRPARRPSPPPVAGPLPPRSHLRRGGDRTQRGSSKNTMPGSLLAAQAAPWRPAMDSLRACDHRAGVLRQRRPRGFRKPPCGSYTGCGQHRPRGFTPPSSPLAGTP